MGGWGSGRTEYATTPTVEECRQLDVNQFTESIEQPGRGGPIYWGDPDDPAGSIDVVLLSGEHLEALTDGKKLETTPVEKADPEAVDAPPDDTRAVAMYIKYTLTPPGDGESREVSYPVPLEYTKCNFGGFRPWFRCPPRVGGCGRRSGKLYLPLPVSVKADYFLCRECYDLGYHSSRTSGDDLKQAELRYRRAFAKADAENRRPHPNNPPLTPDRPKGMHQDTFEDLKGQVTRAELEWSEEMRKKTNQLFESLDTVDADPVPRPSGE